LPCRIVGLFFTRYRVRREKFIAEVDTGKQAFIKVDQDNEIWIAYYDPMNSIYVRNIKEEKALPVNTARTRQGAVLPLIL